MHCSSMTEFPTCINQSGNILFRNDFQNKQKYNNKRNIFDIPLFHLKASLSFCCWNLNEFVDEYDLSIIVHTLAGK